MSFTKAAFSLFALYGKQGSFSGEDNPERCSESFCDESSEDDCDSSVNERDKESHVEIAISSS